MGENDYGDMFIMQKANNIVPLVPNFGNENEDLDGEVSIVEIGSRNLPHYSNISDVDDSEIQSSQLQAHVR